MNLHSPSPYWLLHDGIIKSYPSLNHDLKTDIVIIGAGICGALVANELCRAGYEATITDRRHVGFGSRAASTSLPSYSIGCEKKRFGVIICAGKRLMMSKNYAGH